VRAVGNGFRPAGVRMHGRWGPRGYPSRLVASKASSHSPLMRVISISIVRQRATMGRSEQGAVVWDGRPSGPGTLWGGRQLEEGETKDH
jgi:hypothetical protein